MWDDPWESLSAADAGLPLLPDGRPPSEVPPREGLEVRCQSGGLPLS